MAIQKKEYELSVWVETLNTSGTESVKEERKLGIIGAHDMSYNGRASLIKLQTKINGTHNLTFQMPDKWFDSEKGDFVRNEFLDLAQNERKVKLYYKNEWYEFFIKNIKMNKKFKSYMYDFTCTDAYIDELARNGYDITFNTDLSNNVEEIGVFTEEIIDGSQWHYTPENNWGDFTEYSEERLFKIPISQFTSIPAHKLNFTTSETDAIQNRYTKEKRTLELGDDLARAHEWYWDAQNSSKNISLLGGAATTLSGIGEYIYVPFSQLDFCYVTTGETGGNNILVSTEEPAYDENGKYYLAPASIDPTALIEFIAIPEGAEVDIDESGLIVNKEYTYVMTVEEWNKAVSGTTWYFFEQYKDASGDHYKEIVINPGTNAPIYGNKVVIYDGYLGSLGDVEVVNGKKIVISDRTVKNISEDIDEYVKVYNKPSTNYTDLLTNPDGWVNELGMSYKVCSDLQSRTIEPQLARNYIQNGVNIKSTDGWEIMATPDDQDTNVVAAQLKMETSNEESTILDINSRKVWLSFTRSKNTKEPDKDKYDTILNFGAIGQEKTIKKGKIYCLGLEVEGIPASSFIIGEGKISSKGNYEFVNNDEKVEMSITSNQFYLVSFNRDIEKPYIGLYLEGNCKIYNFWFFEAYTKGIDFFANGYYRYSGRDIQYKLNSEGDDKYKRVRLGSKDEATKKVIFENDIMSGGVYGYRRYFIQQLKTTLKNEATKVYDTFGATKYTSEDVTDVSTTLPLPASKYGEDDYKIVTNYIDLGKCPHYKGNTPASDFDCNYGSSSDSGIHVCSYQKYGYCPYLFQTEKHCRRTRTLTGEKSNRFNLTQETSKVFEVYPNYYIEHTPIGAVKYDDSGRPIKDIFYMTEKGKVSKVGFRYEKNLSNITKTVVSDQIVTKLYVQDTDSTLSKTGLCSIATAVDNPSKDRFIIDLSYYVKQGMLDKEQTEEDLYGSEHNENSFAFLKKLGYYNSMYDAISNKIINLTNQEYGGLESNLYVNLTGIETALKEIAKIKKQMAKYRSNTTSAQVSDENQTYQNYVTKLREQQKTLINLVNDTFYTNGVTYTDQAPLIFIDEHDITTIKDTWVGNSEYKSYGMIGQYNTRYEQVQNWKKERAKYLHDINALSEQFFKRYEPYLKEGTWSSSNYLTDDAYYHDALEVAAEGAIPKVTYDINVVPLDTFNEDYEFGVGDITWVEDIGMFDVNRKTGFPNRLKTLVSELNEGLDIPTQSTIKVQNFTTQFEDLFEQVTASVQSLTFNENIYKRASNFTATKNVKTDSLQGTLDTNELTLLDTAESNIKLDSEGQAGSDINNHNNKYKLNGQGLFFSNDAGEHWNIGVGPSGINADYIKTGTLDAGKIRIVDGEYLYFLWDKSGITAYREPQNVSQDSHFGDDYAKFNKYGLSLVENNKIRLRAGYGFSGTDGDIDTENTTSGDVGFFLYNNEGKPIFSTYAKNYTARLSLTGEMYVNSKLAQETYTEYTYTHSYQFTNPTYPVYNIGEVMTGITDEHQTTTQIYLIKNDNTVIITYLWRSDVAGTPYFVKINNVCYGIRSNNQVYYFNRETSGDTVKTRENVSLSTVWYIRNTSGTLRFISERFYYVSSTGKYYKEKDSEQITPTSDNDEISIFINNSTLDGPAKSDNGYYKRLFNCIKKDKNNKLYNVLSLLADGTLYIGGTITQDGGSTTLSDLQALNDYIKVNTDATGHKAISLTPDGEVLLGTENLVDRLEQQIAELEEKAMNAGVPPHSHNIGSLSIDAIQTEEYTCIPDYYATTLSGGRRNTRNYDGIQYEFFNENDGHEININEFVITAIKPTADISNSGGDTNLNIVGLSIDNLAELVAQRLKTHPGSTAVSQTTGGSTPVYNPTIETDSEIVAKAYDVVKAHYNNMMSNGLYGHYYSQSLYYETYINGIHIWSRRDCSGLIMGIWQYLQDVPYGFNGSTRTMYGTHPYNWSIIEQPAGGWDINTLRPGDVLVNTDTHTEIISKIVNGVIYTYSLGIDSALAASYNNTNTLSYWLNYYNFILRRNV